MKQILPCILVVLLAGCQALGPVAGERMLGEWRTDLAGLTLVSVFGAESVTMRGQEPIPYHVDGAVLRFDTPGAHTFAIEFTDRGTMVLTDQVTGTSQVYTRVAD